MTDFNNLSHWAGQYLRQWGLPEDSIRPLSLTIDLVLLSLISWLSLILAKRVLLQAVGRYVKRSKTDLDDILLEKKVFNALAYYVPALVIYYVLPYILDQGNFAEIVQKGLSLYMLIIFINVAHRFFKAMEFIGLRSKRFAGKPVSSYIQVATIVLYIVGAVLIISTLLDKSATAILTTFGAATAILLLVFRDTILGLVASIQISGNDMVRLGDWVSMEKYGADGDVIEINLTTVKVRNWDKTISTVPTYAFISDSFKNWRGMQSTGVRRILRNINIDLHSIRYADEAMLKRFRKYERIAGFIEERQYEIDRYNQENKVDKSELINGRHMTNIGLFRRYALAYLEQHPMVAKSEIVMVRQLQPTETGLPLQIYCFSSDIAWLNYEGIQSDIMDHLLAAVERFELRIYQSPSGADFRRLSGENKA